MPGTLFVGVLTANLYVRFHLANPQRLIPISVFRLDNHKQCPQRAESGSKKSIQVVEEHQDSTTDPNRSICSTNVQASDLFARPKVVITIDEPFNANAFG